MRNKSKDLTKPRKASVRIEKITVDPAVYQPRRDGINHGHVSNLKATLGRGQVLDPISVRQRSDGMYVVLDGHHSFEAYHQAQWDRGVPVSVYDCTEAEGQLVAIRENSKHRLQMADEDRSDWAWRLTCEQPELSKAQVSQICNRSTSTIGRMRPVRETLLAAGVELPETWRMAQRACKNVDGGEFDEDRAAQWREDTIAKIKEQISGAISPYARWNADVVLEAVWNTLGDNRFRLGLEYHGFREVFINEYTEDVTLLDSELLHPSDDGDGEDEPF